MKKFFDKRWMIGILLVATLAGCGGGEGATPAPTVVPTVAPAAGTDDSDNVEQSVSPLTEPESPLSQPASPLPANEPAAQTTATGSSGPSIAIAVPSDIGVITQIAQDTKSPPPQEGMASLSAVLYSPTINRIIPGTQFYLTPALEEDGQTFIPSMFVGPKEDKGDVLGISNDQGQLFLDNVPPGKYYLAVWTIYNWPLAFGAQNDELPLLITVEAGDVQDLGLLYVEWP